MYLTPCLLSIVQSALHFTPWQNYSIKHHLMTVGRVTGHVGSVTTSAVKSLDASAKYFGRVGKILGRVLVASAAQDWSPRQGYHFGDTFFGHLDI